MGWGVWVLPSVGTRKAARTSEPLGDSTANKGWGVWGGDLGGDVGMWGGFGVGIWGGMGGFGGGGLGAIQSWDQEGCKDLQAVRGQHCT